MLFVFLLLQGISFYLLVDHFSQFTGAALEQDPTQAYFSSLFVPISLLLVCPALSMRLFAEERKSGTIESLLTAPVAPASVVWAKYLAVLATFVLLWLPTSLYVVIVRNIAEIDWPVVIASYVGIFAVGAAYLAIGVLMSSLAQNQLSAHLLTTFALFGLFIFGVGERIFDPGVLRDLCAHVSVLSQLEDFAQGVIDGPRLIFDASVTLVCLFLTQRVVEAWRWA
jgi:ABC-2 type transport system permease protein